VLAVVCSCSGTQPPDHKTATLDGQRAVVLRPEHPTGGLVIYSHGNNGTAAEVTRGHQATVASELVRRGWTVAASDMHGNNWGSQAAVDDLANLYRWAHPTGPTVLWAASMGTIPALYAAAGRTVPVVVLVASSPVCDPDTLTKHRPGTARHPLDDIDPAALHGVALRWYASPEDHLVPKTANADRCAGRFGGQVTETRGGHTDRSNYPADAIAAWLDTVVP
jgi:alpha-beta hydrolase superfamily lysophospholipase